QPWYLSAERRRQRLYTSAVSPALFGQFPHETFAGRGRRRVAFAVKDGEAIRGIADNQTPAAMSGATSVQQPVRIGLMNWCLSGQNQPLTGVTLHAITIWPEALDDAGLDSLGARAMAAPVHFVGDSFLNLDAVPDQLRLRVNARQGYLGFSSDGVGGSTLAQQAARFAGYTGSAQKWWDATLVIVDGGTEDPADVAQASIARMLKHLTHERWLYVEAGSAPASAGYGADAAAWTAFREKQRVLQHFCGDHYVPVLREAMRRSDGSLADETNVDQLRWPVSLMTSDADFHPNANGATMLGEVIADALISRRWL
ncbi:MAG: SGNH/GDSL hydrolase family protein, partial [Pseudomonadota bacterium]